MILYFNISELVNNIRAGEPKVAAKLSTNLVSMTYFIDIRRIALCI